MSIIRPKCSRCGTRVPLAARFCQRCGHSKDHEEIAASMRALLARRPKGRECHSVLFYWALATAVLWFVVLCSIIWTAYSEGLL